MQIGGFQKLSFIDFPEIIASVVFTQGCNWRCPWCHNPNLVYPDRFEDPIPEKTVFDYLTNRRDQIEGVVISGGEPTLHKDLPDFIQRIKKMGFLIKLDTNGSCPDELESLVQSDLLDYIAMDVKGSLKSYSTIVGTQPNLKTIRQSISLIRGSGIKHEFRSTIVPKLHQKQDASDLAELVKGVEHFVLQAYSSGKTNPSNNIGNPDHFQELFEYYCSRIEPMVQSFEIKGKYGA